MTIGRLIECRSPEVVSCNSSTSVRDAISLLAERRIGALPVLDGGHVVGIFSERDVLYQLNSHGPAMLDRSVGDVMTAPAVSVSPETEVLSALALMTKRRIRHLPVQQDGTMIGFVSIGDLVKYRIERIESEAESMRSYIQAV
jgi:CBS domain-containing protein